MLQYNIKAIKINTSDEIAIEKLEADIEEKNSELNNDNDNDKSNTGFEALENAVEEQKKKNVRKKQEEQETKLKKKKENIEGNNSNKSIINKSYKLYHPYKYEDIKKLLMILDEDKLSDCLDNNEEEQKIKMSNFTKIKIGLKRNIIIYLIKKRIH